MSDQPRILRASTQTLTLYPQPGAGQTGRIGVLDVPSAVTVRVRTPAVDMPAAGVAGTVDPFTTTLTADAAAGDESFTTGQVTTTRGQQLLIESSGIPPAVVVIGKQTTSGTTVQLATPLSRAYAANSSLTGFGVSVALTALQTAQEGECLARWTMTLRGVVYTIDQQFRIVKQHFSFSLNEARLFAAYPFLYRIRMPTDLDVEDAFIASWEYRVLPMLEARGVSLEKVKSPQAFEPVHALAVVCHLLSMDESKPDLFVKSWEDKYEQAVETCFSRKTFWYDNADQDAPRPEPEDQDDFDVMFLTR